MIGQVGKTHATGDHQVNLLKIQASLQGPDTVLRAFCTGCGSYLELTWAAVEAYAQDAGIPIPDSFEGAYFQTGQCELCDSDDTTVTLHHLPV